MLWKTLTGRRSAAVVVGVLVAVALPAGVAMADPPGPTDYVTTILGVEPATPAIHVEMIGGDSFVQLTVDRGTDVVVVGYLGEPYLRFTSDGTVVENRHSPTVAQNEDRYGDATAPVATGDASAAPEWVEVAHDGRYAWHDHRAHWMSTDAPPGFRRGDRIQDGTIRLQVDGVPVAVAVTTTWEEAPSQVPLAAGAILAVFAVMIALSARRRIAWVLVVAAAAAGAIGWVQVRSVPAYTGPSDVWWLLPLVAGASGLIAVVLGRSLASHALLLLGGVELGLWVFLRRDGLTRSILPTDAPFWLDRGVTTAAGVAATVAAMAAVTAMFRSKVTDPSWS